MSPGEHTAASTTSGMHTVDMRHMLLPSYDEATGHDLMHKAAGGTKMTSQSFLDWSQGGL
jgi:hypothetical protein